MDNIKKTIVAGATAAAVVAGFIENKLEPMAVAQADATTRMDQSYAASRLAEKGMTDNWSQPVAQPKVPDWFSAKR